MKSDTVLILPGWLDSGPDHWQSRWQATHGYTRVAQHDWARPLRGDWIARLEDVVLAQEPNLPITLVAHGLGCLLVAAWAALSRNTQRVKCAFLAAPCDVALEALRPVLTSWKPGATHAAQATHATHPPRQPIKPIKPTTPSKPMLSTASTTKKSTTEPSRQSTPQALPFRSLLLASHNDPYCSFEQAQALATAWGSEFMDLGTRGHINAASGLGDWPQGHALLLALQRRAPVDALENGIKNSIRTGSKSDQKRHPHRLRGVTGGQSIATENPTFRIL